jgi:hypothetical protein
MKLIVVAIGLLFCASFLLAQGADANHSARLVLIKHHAKRHHAHKHGKHKAPKHPKRA